MLHERNALPLDRVGDEHLGCVTAVAEAREHLPERSVVVAVAGRDIPSERAQLRLEVAQRQDLVGRLVGLERVAVDDDPEAAEAVVGRCLERLPVLSLLQLTVTGHDDDHTLAPGVALAPGDPAALRDAHAERARVRLDPGDVNVRVAVEPAQPAQPREPLRRDDAETVERRVETGHVVSLRGEEHVAVGALEAHVGDVQLLVEELNDDVERAEARAEMPGAGLLDGNEGVQAADVGEQREARVGIAGRGADRVDVALRDERELRHAGRR